MIDRFSSSLLPSKLPLGRPRSVERDCETSILPKLIVDQVDFLRAADRLGTPQVSALLDHPLRIRLPHIKAQPGWRRVQIAAPLEFCIRNTS